jgi:hypothetical protein
MSYQWAVPTMPYIDTSAAYSAGGNGFSVNHARPAAKPRLRWCNKCQGLYDPYQYGSLERYELPVRCPQGGAHNVPAATEAKRALDKRQQELAGRYLDRLDRDHPAWHVPLAGEPPVDYSRHRDWLAERRDYITGDDDALQRMCGHVTADCPPLSRRFAIAPAVDTAAAVARANKRADRLVGIECWALMLFAALVFLIAIIAI